MLQTKDTNNDMENGFQSSHSGHALKSQNEESSENLHHGSEKETHSKAHNHDLDEDNAQINQADAEDDNSEKEERNPSHEEETGQKTAESAKEEDRQNLNTNNMVEEGKGISETPLQADNTPEDQDEKEQRKEEENPDFSALSTHNLELDIKHQHDITMSLEEEDAKSPQTRPGEARSDKNGEATSSAEGPEIDPNQKEKAAELLKQLRSFVSNPIHDLKSNINNIIVSANHTVERYKKHSDNQISLASKWVDPLQHETLSEGIRRAKIVRLEAEKKSKLSPIIFQTRGTNIQTTTKAKLAKNKSINSAMKVKAQVSVRWPCGNSSV